MDYKDISVVYEDNHILVAVKPQNVPVQADSSGDDDMLSMLKKYLQRSLIVLQRLRLTIY